MLSCVGRFRQRWILKQFLDNGVIATANKKLMENSKLTELNRLFEKAVSNQASMDETLSLNALYKDFIDEGRDMNRYDNNRKINLVNSQAYYSNDQQSKIRHVS